jgi:hypothetical protein
MTLTDAFLYIATHGCRLSRGAAGLVLTVPEGAEVPPEVAATIKAHRDEILATFEAPANEAKDDPDPAFEQWAGEVDALLETFPAGDTFEVWAGQTLGQVVALDTETTVTATDHPGEAAPDMILGQVFDGSRGYFLAPDQVAAFLKVHHDRTLVCHFAEFDIPVLEKVLEQTGDHGLALAFVDRNQVRDTYLFDRLLVLATTGETEGVAASLQDLTKKYLTQDLDKDAGTRLTFGEFAGRPIAEIPEGHLEYAARDAVSTFNVWQKQTHELDRIKDLAKTAYGYGSEQDLTAAWETFGPLSLFVQIKTAVVFRYMGRNGLWSDAARRDEALEALRVVVEEAKATLDQAGIPTTTAGKTKAIQAYFESLEGRLLAEGKISKPLKRTTSGRICLDLEQRTELAAAEVDPVVTAFARFEQATKFRNTYLRKITGAALHPRWKYLTRSGRTSCVGDLSVQTLPRDDSGLSGKFSVRQCVVPPPGMVFVGADYSQLEVVSFAAVLADQLKFGDSLAQVLRKGWDVHCCTAMYAFGNRIGPVSPKERKRVKAIVFGLPGTLSKDGIRRTAKLAYNVTLSDEEIDQIVAGYKTLCPEIDKHLARGNDLGERTAKVFGLKGKSEGWRLIKTLKGEATNYNGEPLSKAQLDRIWTAAKRVFDLCTLGPNKKKALAKQIEDRRPSKALSDLVRAIAGRESYLSATGRLRAGCTFAASRNGVFQSLAADGALLALWKLFRSGYRVSAFIHDELIVSVEDNGRYREHVETISRVMKETMSEVLGGLPVQVEPFVRRSLSPRDTVQLEPEEEPLPPLDFFCPKTETQPTDEDAGPVEEGGLLVGFTFDQPRPRTKNKGAGVIATGRGRRTPDPRAVSYDPETDQDLPF